MDSQLIRACLAHDEILVHTFDTLNSTNTCLLEMAAENAAEWSVVTADQQTAGRGRYQRNWHSASGKGLYFSLLLKPDIPVRFFNLINLFVALQLADFLEDQFRERGVRQSLQLKWPNDLFLNGKKLCGILLEGSLSGGQNNTLVVGVGINVNHEAADWPDEINDIAISLRQASEGTWSREYLLAGFLNLFYKNFNAQFPHKMGEIVHLYWQKVMNSRKMVRLTIAGELQEGLFAGLTPEGFMRLEKDGVEQIIATGELLAG
ncbi:MAG: biotin--[acetyl-CoA-carboxylase] ligase [Calditrichia bacterium]